MSKRMMRADAEIVRVVSKIVSSEMRDPRLSSFITITSAKTTPDFRYCKIGVSILTEDKAKKQEILNVLKKSSGFIKREMSEELNMPYIPELTFVLDENALYSERINEILSSLNIPKEEEVEGDNSQD